MIVQFRTTVSMSEDGEIQTTQVLKTKNLTDEVAEMVPDLNRLQDTFRSGILAIMADETSDSPVDDDDLDEFDDDDEDDEDDETED